MGHVPAEPVDEGAVPGDRLRLVFTCCHPALARPAQVALTLRLLDGLTTPDIARAFLVPEPTMAQRIVRAKAKIRNAHPLPGATRERPARAPRRGARRALPDLQRGLRRDVGRRPAANH
jgi:predicted RNA polymerase sigma factor